MLLVSNGTCTDNCQLVSRTRVDFFEPLLLGPFANAGSVYIELEPCKSSWPGFVSSYDACLIARAFQGPRNVSENMVTGFWMGNSLMNQGHGLHVATNCNVSSPTGSSFNMAADTYEKGDRAGDNGNKQRVVTLNEQESVGIWRPNAELRTADTSPVCT